MITKERIGTELELITNRIKTGIENGKFSLHEVQESVKHKSKKAARQTDYYVHDNAWKAMGITAAIAFIGGMFLSRGRRAQSEGFSFDNQQPEKVVVDEKGNPVPTASKLASWELVHSVLPLALFLWRAAQSTRCDKKGDPTIL
ncbi:MAG: DUF883 family protein [Verrucomicrobiales bacterium]